MELILNKHSMNHSIIKKWFARLCDENSTLECNPHPSVVKKNLKTKTLICTQKKAYKTVKTCKENEKKWVIQKHGKIVLQLSQKRTI